MSNDSLAIVLRLRRLTLENARAVLADILCQQEDAERRLTEAERAIRDETVRATDPGSDDDAVEAFAAWLPAGRRRADAAQAELDHIVAQACQARTVLALARTALEAVEGLAEARHTAPGRVVPPDTAPGGAGRRSAYATAGSPGGVVAEPSGSGPHNVLSCAANSEEGVSCASR